MFFDSYSYDENFSSFLGKSIYLNSDGFIYGNIFKDEYIPYKNYDVYNLKSNSPEGSLKLKIMEETFIINDLNLYLDLHKDDTDMYNIFKEHKSKLDQLINEYETKYSSICLNANKNNYDWTNSPWPWEDKNV